MYMKRSISIIVSIAICLFAGLIASYLQSESIATWYPHLTKSPLTPPSIAFPIIWTILYILMGISIGLIASSNQERRKVLLLIFAIQLTLNFLWSFTFFFIQSPLSGFINILLLDLAVIIYTLKSYRVNRAAAWLCVPYLAWLAIATHLNWYIYAYN